MATIKTRLKQLKDADVRYISLVDRAATRIPFRVLKRDKESKMGIDLTKVFKSDNTAGRKPYVSALVVFAQKDEAAGNQVQEAIKKYGFTTERVQKSDEGETLVFAQRDQTGDVQVVRLSDQLLVTVGELAEAQRLDRGNGGRGRVLPRSADGHRRVARASEGDGRQVRHAAGRDGSGPHQLRGVHDAVGSASGQLFQVGRGHQGHRRQVLLRGSPVAEGDKKDEKDEAVKGETEEEKKKRLKSHSPAEMEPKDEEAEDGPPPEEVEKADDSPVLAALKGMTAQLTSLSQKLESVVTEQASQKKTLDEVTQKADTLGTKLSTTVTANPVSEDRPAPSRMRVQKDDDPRTGNFDTAFLRRRR